MAHQVTLEEAASHLPELVREARGGQEIVFTAGHLPVAQLVPIGEDTPTDSNEPAALLPALLRQWQQEYGLPPRPDGKGHTPVAELFAQWDAEDAHLTPEEAEAAQSLWADHENNPQRVSL